MATFAEYPQQTTMPSSDDFTLFPFNSDMWSQDQQYMPNAYNDQSYMNTSTYDSYAPQQAFDHHHLSDRFVFGADQSYQQTKSNAPETTRSYSPSNSASHSFDKHPPHLSSTSDSGASVPSTLSSRMASPAIRGQHGQWAQQQQQMSMLLNIAQEGFNTDIFASTGYDIENVVATDKGCVDPSLIQPFSPQFDASQFTGLQQVQSPQVSAYPQPPSPAPSTTSVRSPRSSHSRAPNPVSPYYWQPPQSFHGSRRQSVSSIHSHNSQGSAGSSDSNKGLCPIATCGRHFKDLKAHMLTHQNERPEKCPIPVCEYHTKGFARKYDKNRHTLTHYKGTMVCGFCPGSGSAAEKSFNRADVFKRHLTSVHGVEQTPPNARRKSPSGNSTKRAGSGVALNVSGMCSTCSITFANAQDFYEHLDDCVLRVVQQADPSEAINEKLLSSVAEDPDVQETMSKHLLPTTIDYDAPTAFPDEADDDDLLDVEDANDTTYSSRFARSGRGTLKRNKHSSSTNPHTTASGAITKSSNGRNPGLTRSKNGVPLSGPPASALSNNGTVASGKGNKRRKNYPLSWGASADKMKMKKRVLCIYDGQRRLWKDDMMLNGDHEVRIPLGPGGIGAPGSWVTDLDVQTLRRAEGVHGATEEERGPWVAEGMGEVVGEEEMRALMQ